MQLVGVGQLALRLELLSIIQTPLAVHAGILHQSAEGGVDGAMQDEDSALYHACTMVGCEPEDLQRGIVQLLQQVTSAALPGATAAEGSAAGQPESQSLSADADSNIDPQY
jgi:hypothetical protein